MVSENKTPGTEHDTQTIVQHSGSSDSLPNEPVQSQDPDSDSDSARPHDAAPSQDSPEQPSGPLSGQETVVLSELPPAQGGSTEGTAEKVSDADADHAGDGSSIDAASGSADEGSTHRAHAATAKIPHPMRPASKLPDLSSYEGTADPSHSQDDEVFSEPLPTASLQVRPPQEEVDRRSSERDRAVKAQPVLPRIMQVLLAVFYPVVLLVLAIRLITTPLFLWVEYHRQGFPPDSFGFSTDDRMTYGSYTVDYLLNFAGPRYLGGLVGANGRQLFAAGEVSHMADVKSVITMAFTVCAVLAVGMIVALIYLRRHRVGGIRRGLFAGSIVTLVIVIALGVLASLGWETFFTDFHHIFFKNGTWTFYLDDTLIRLFPGQFWVDSGVVIGLAVFVVSTLTFAFTWPTKRRRQISARAKNPAQGRRAAAEI